jgi:hypothetical protein
LLVLVAACSGKGSDQNTTTIVQPTKPMGFVGGSVENATAETPLANATVALTGGGLAGAVTTDAQGNFSFGPISAGAAFSLHITQEGMADATLTDLMIADAAGNFPTGNGALWVGPVELIPLTGKFQVQVVSGAGTPVPKAQVTMETGVRYFLEGAARSTFVGSALTDPDGLATVMPMPDLRSIPPRLAEDASLVINVAPVDIDGDGKPDLRGATLAMSGADLRANIAVPIIVLNATGTTTLQIVASNVPRLVNGTATAPGVLDLMEPVRLVFSQIIDRNHVNIDLRDEIGQTQLTANSVVGTLGNILFITPTMPLEIGREYNVAFRVEAPNAGKPLVLTAAAPFFTKVDPAMPVVAAGRFVDGNSDGMWGTAGDVFSLSWSVPLGRPGASPAFHARVWVDLDLNASGRAGDSPGELPMIGAPYPDGLPVAAAEPNPPNGAGLSGFTRFFAPIPITLMTPRGAGQGPVNFEVHLLPEDNQGTFVTDVSGRDGPSKVTGQAVLQ